MARFTFILSLGGLLGWIMVSAAAAASVRETRPGEFFTAKPGDSRFELRLDPPQTETYATVIIEFDARAPSFPGKALHSIVDFVSRGNQGRYFAVQHTLLRSDEKGVRTLVDNLAGGTSATRTDILEPVKRGVGADLRYRIEYSVAKRRVSVTISNLATGQKDEFVEEKTREGAPLVEETEIRNEGAGLIVGLGLNKVYDHGGYYPPYGWTFSNLSVELQTGDLTAKNAENAKNQK